MLLNWLAGYYLLVSPKTTILEILHISPSISMQTPNKIITIDCDNVLSDTHNSFARYYQEHYGDSYMLDQLDQPYLRDIALFNKIPHDEFGHVYMDFFVTSHENDTMLLMPWAIEGIQALDDAGYELHMLTGRREIQKQASVDRIERHFPGKFVACHFTNDLTEKSIPKGEICRQLWATAHVDDFLHYAETITALGIPVLLYDRPWNHMDNHDPLLHRVFDWEEIVYTIQQFS